MALKCRLGMAMTMCALASTADNFIRQLIIRFPLALMLARKRLMEGWCLLARHIWDHLPLISWFNMAVGEASIRSRYRLLTNKGENLVSLLLHQCAAIGFDI